MSGELETTTNLIPFPFHHAHPRTLYVTLRASRFIRGSINSEVKYRGPLRVGKARVPAATGNLHNLQHVAVNIQSDKDMVLLTTATH